MPPALCAPRPTWLTSRHSASTPPGCSSRALATRPRCVLLLLLLLLSRSLQPLPLLLQPPPPPCRSHYVCTQGAETCCCEAALQPAPGGADSFSSCIYASRTVLTSDWASVFSVCLLCRIWTRTKPPPQPQPGRWRRQPITCHAPPRLAAMPTTRMRRCWPASCRVSTVDRHGGLEGGWRLLPALPECPTAGQLSCWVANQGTQR